ncbi:MAG: BatA domain-containing protein, partial [marine benthic group bacterium]|nr:BatA domain-containing protein [Candidatus Benthicola marisminoris]
MSFLAPWALALATLAVVPVLLHLFRRDTRRRMAFPAIRYLRSAQDRSARALKLRDRLLLMVRMALVTAIAAAAAVPLLGRGQATDHAASDLALIIDNSASMNRTVADTTLLDRQRARALKLLEAAIGGDRFWVLPTVGSPVALGSDSRSAYSGVLSIPPTDAAADMGGSVVEALRLLPTGLDRAREILVMSDFQATSIGQSVAALPEDVRLLFSWSDASAGNRAIVDLEAVPPL